MMGQSVGRAMALGPGARKCSLGHYRVIIVAPESLLPRAAKTERFVQNYTIKVPAKILDLRLRPPPDPLPFALWDSCVSIFLGKADPRRSTAPAWIQKAGHGRLADPSGNHRRGTPLKERHRGP